MKTKGKQKPANERRSKIRFPMHQEIRYKVLDDCRIVAQGRGETVDMSSGGISFRTNGVLPLSCYVEASVSWPVLLDDRCRMQLIVIGRVIRIAGGVHVCTIEKWEFRTQAREVREIRPMRVDDNLLRWVEYRREVALKAGMAATA